MPFIIPLGASFEFPDILTVKDYSRYKSEAIDALEIIEDDKDKKDVAAWAVIFCAAVNAGLIRNWRSKLMPVLDVQKADEAHAFTVLWVAVSVHEWIERQRYVDPKVSWRRLMLWIETALHRLTLLPRGVALGFRILRRFS